MPVALYDKELNNYDKYLLKIIGFIYIYCVDDTVRPFTPVVFTQLLLDCLKNLFNWIEPSATCMIDYTRGYSDGNRVVYSVVISYQYNTVCSVARCTKHL